MSGRRLMARQTYHKRDNLRMSARDLITCLGLNQRNVNRLPRNLRNAKTSHKGLRYNELYFLSLSLSLRKPFIIFINRLSFIQGICSSRHLFSGYVSDHVEGNFYFLVEVEVAYDDSYCDFAKTSNFSSHSSCEMGQRYLPEFDIT